MGNSVLECKGLVKNYGRKTALNGIDLTINRGRRIGLLGPNGSGKSTLINLIPRFYDVTKGSIKINGIDTEKNSFTRLIVEIFNSTSSFSVL